MKEKKNFTLTFRYSFLDISIIMAEFVITKVESLAPIAIGVKLMNDKAKVPTRAHVSNAGHDIYSAEEIVLIEPWGQAVIDTGLQLDMPNNGLWPNNATLGPINAPWLGRWSGCDRCFVSRHGESVNSQF